MQVTFGEMAFHKLFDVKYFLLEDVGLFVGDTTLSPTISFLLFTNILFNPLMIMFRHIFSCSQSFFFLISFYPFFFLLSLFWWCHSLFFSVFSFHYHR